MAAWAECELALCWCIPTSMLVLHLHIVTVCSELRPTMALDWALRQQYFLLSTWIPEIDGRVWSIRTHWKVGSNCEPMTEYIKLWSALQLAARDANQIFAAGFTLMGILYALGTKQLNSGLRQLSRSSFMPNRWATPPPCSQKFTNTLTTYGTSVVIRKRR